MRNTEYNNSGFNHQYIGNELELFKHATNWKKYWITALAPYIKGNVLEVGAGIGANTDLILSNVISVDKITCVEPDDQLAKQISLRKQAEQKHKIEVVVGYLRDVPAEKKFDTIIYIDVIEHIDDDKAELLHAVSFLKPGGYLVVLVPAYQYLYSDFDNSIGHFRRYNKQMLKTIGIEKEGCPRKRIFYLDSIGLLASLANKILLKQSYPTISQVKFWDNVMIPFSRIVDVITFQSFGKSLIGVWQRTN
jgi:SAM-dependent methyltransferase